MKKENLKFFFETLEKKYPDANTELIRKTPYQLLISVILSAQTTDKQVNKVTSRLFKQIKTPKDTVDMGLDKLQQEIKSIGLYKSKSNNIYKTSLLLADENYQKKAIQADTTKELKKQKEKYGYIIPNKLKDLQDLNGVGEKTAKVVAHVLYGLPVIAVDTHVHRVTNRIGLVKTKTPLQTSKKLETTVPPKYMQKAHHGLILFGRYHCKARKPMCIECPFKDFCFYYKNKIKKV